MKEALRKELQKIRSLKGKEKWEYIWDYYKLHIIGTIILLWISGSIINDTIINPPPQSVLTIAWMAGFEPDDRLNALSVALYPKLEELVENPGREAVQVLNFFMGADPQLQMANHHRFAAMTAANELDIIIGTVVIHEEERITLGLAPTWGLRDIRTYIPEANAEGLLFYESEEYGTIAFAVPLEGSAFFNTLGLQTENVYLGIMINSLREEAVQLALHAILP